MKRTGLTILVLIVLAACTAQPSPTPTPDKNLLDTAVAKTLTSSAPTWTPIPSNTPLPTLAQPTQGPSRTPRPTATLRPSLTPTPGLQATPLSGSLLPGGVPIEGIACLPANTTQDLGIVMRVISGDSIEVLVNGAIQAVHYIGIQTPQGVGSTPSARLATVALQKNKALVDGKVVVLIKDSSDKDRNGALLRYVVSGNIFINYELVRQGLAISLNTPPDSTCQKTFDAAQAQAMQAKIGLWVPTPTLPPGVTPTFRPSVH